MPICRIDGDFEEKSIQMTCENSTRATEEGPDPWPENQGGQMRTYSRVDKRDHPRFAYPVRASVEVPFLPTKEYGICDFSRSGMFLAYTDIRATRQMLEQNRTEPGADLVIRFTVSLPDETHCCRVRARLVRITLHGIGIRFAPSNPWQLSALTDLIARAQAGSDVFRSADE